MERGSTGADGGPEALGAGACDAAGAAAAGWAGRMAEPLCGAPLWRAGGADTTVGGTGEEGAAEGVAAAGSCGGEGAGAAGGTAALAVGAGATAVELGTSTLVAVVRDIATSPRVAMAARAVTEPMTCLRRVLAWGAATSAAPGAGVDDSVTDWLAPGSDSPGVRALTMSPAAGAGVVEGGVPGASSVGSDGLRPLASKCAIRATDA